MRLNNQQVETIKSNVTEVFGHSCNTILFGSRTDNSKKGGDIDLLLVPNHEIENERQNTALLYIKLIKALGDQKIDIIIHRKNDTRLIVKEALKNGVLL